MTVYAMISEIIRLFLPQSVWRPIGEFIIGVITTTKGVIQPRQLARPSQILALPLDEAPWEVSYPYTF